MGRSIFFVALLVPVVASPAASAQTYHDNALSMGAARSRMEHSGFRNIQNLRREGDSSWMAGARDRHGAPYSVSVDRRGKVYGAPSF